jgi:predicted O-linked N-acetylglucosamine transferase (SPINDLY family)
MRKKSKTKKSITKKTEISSIQEISVLPQIPAIDLTSVAGNIDHNINSHPLMIKAKQSLNVGNLKETVQALLDLSMISQPLECAQILCKVSDLIKDVNFNQSLKLALDATKIESFYSFTWFHLSKIYHYKRMIKDAREAGLKALKAKASAIELVDMGRHLSTLGGADVESLEAVKKGYKLSNDSINLASYTLRVALQNADWELSEKIIKQLSHYYEQGHASQSPETPRTHLLWCQDEKINIEVISNFAKKNYPSKEHLKLEAPSSPQKRKLRIAYISSDFREHPTSLLALGMMRFHNRERFELFGYCNSYDDGSVLRREMSSRFDIFRSIKSLNDLDLAKLIMNDKVDVLIDLNGLTEGARHGALAYRPAHVQISYLGFPGTAGGRFFDYIVADPYTIPIGVESLYPEKIIRIAPTYQINDYYSRFLPPPLSRSSAKLPNDKFIFGMFNNINKVGPEVWNAWIKILLSVPKGILWLLDPGEPAKKRLIKYAVDQGLSENQIIFAPKFKQEKHIARLQLADLILDPWPYNGHTTTGDALFAGVPVVSLEGKNFASRVSGGLLIGAGLSNFVKSNIQEYIKFSIACSKNPDQMNKIKNHLKKSRFNISSFDSISRTAQLEAAYIEAYKLKANGKEAQHINVRYPTKLNSAANELDNPRVKTEIRI